MKKVNIAIMGLGTVGGGTYDILINNHDLLMKTQGIDFCVKKVLDRDVDRVLRRGVPAEIVTDKLGDILADEEISIVVEVMGGVEPAKSFITQVLQSGKSVVTANKELIGKHWHELEPVARKHGVGLYFEASCVGGVPIIRTLTDGMQANHITQLYGIINGTTNYILTKMAEEGIAYDAALKQAQELGFAEANPTADVDGYDAMYKLSILSSLAFHTCIPYQKVYREGITRISAEDIRSGQALGYTLKLLAIGQCSGKKVTVRVHPTFVPNDHPLASVRGSFNAVFLKGDFVDDIMLYGRGAGANPTGSAIVSDVVYCAKRKEHVYTDFDNSGRVEQGVQIVGDFTGKYYLSMLAEDKAGSLAKIAAVLGNHGVSISTMIQRAPDKGYASIVFLTHEAGENAVSAALAEIEGLAQVRTIESVIRVI